jgi:type VI secretion system protein ImpB
MSALLDVRSKLKDLLSRTEGNDRLEEMLEEIIGSTDVQGRLQGALGSDGAPAEEAAEAPADESTPDADPGEES